MAPPQPFKRLPLILATSLALCTASLFGAACGGGGGGGGGAGGGSNVGSVAVLLTDGPVDPDTFQNIFLSITRITLIGEPGQVVIFQGREVVDLRDMEDVSHFFALGRKVPAGTYSKMRLDVDEIELVPADGSPSIFPKLPPKIDLNPQGDFRVLPGRMLVVQVDVDGGKSLLIIGKGNGGVNFRPVIFADILSQPKPGKLLLLRGVIEEVNASDGSFLLCDTHAVSRPEGSSRTTLMERPDDDGGQPGDGDEDDRDDFCVRIVSGPDTSYFDVAGDPTDFDALSVGDPAAVLGRFQRFDDEKLVFDAEVVQLGDRTLAVDGVVLSEVDADGRFRIELDPGQGIVTDDGTLLIELQAGSKVFRRRGDPLEPEDIQVGDPVRASGVLALSSMSEDLFKAAFVVVDVAAMETQRLSGVIASVESNGASLELDTDAGSQCVNVPAGARVFRVTLDDGQGSAEAIDRSQLQVGDQVDVFGFANGCFQAETVIVFVVQGSSAAASLGAGVPTTGTHPGLAAAELAAEQPADGAVAGAGSGVRVHVLGPRLTEAGLNWVKLPEGEEDPAQDPAQDPAR